MKTYLVKVKIPSEWRREEWVHVTQIKVGCGGSLLIRLQGGHFHEYAGGQWIEYDASKEQVC